ncbi:cysteine proteinase, partial [Metschnikowia bicuspidata var. bicuspidata NRRL YB-4993]
LNPLSDLHQDILSDCSFVLSLLSISELGLARKLIENVTIFENGTAKVRLLIDGCWRETGITTKLPHFKQDEDRYLFVHSTRSDSLLWPALLEKAYVTSFEGHYSFDGSNMANDTYVLTGWLPEILLMDQEIQLRLSEFMKSKMAGSLMIGLGTGRIASTLEGTLGIISNHDYVLSDYDIHDGSYTLTNPWAFREKDNKKFKRLLKIDRRLLRHFKFLYLNWKPSHANESKIFFVTSPSALPTEFLGDKSQFHLRNGSAKLTKVWIFVEKFQEAKSEFCVSVWRDAKHTIFTSNQYECVLGGKFVNSKHHLIKLEMEPEQNYILTVVSRDQKSSKFAITVYHDSENITFARAKSSCNYRFPTITGYWGQGTSGGNWLNETFINNPQYDLVINMKTRFEVALCCVNRKVDVNLHMLHCNPKESGKKVRKLDQSKLMFSEKYTQRLFHHVIEDLEPGNYKLLASTYNPREEGEFKLMIAYNGDKAVEVNPTPQALGTFMKETSFEWNISNRKKLEIVTLHSQTEVTFHLRLGLHDAQQANNYRPAIRASVFDSLTRQPIIVTNEWSDSVYGIFLDCCLPELDRPYILLVERFETGEGICRVSAGSSHRLEIQELIN